MPTQPRNLHHGGQTVTLASWENEVPPVHGGDLVAKSWNDQQPRKGMYFYDSTVNYMRNDWAAAHMSPVNFDLPLTVNTDQGSGQQVRTTEQHKVTLYYSGATDSWHTAHALDIDHEKEWKKHLVAKGVDNYADAHMAYNDVDNLRLLPSVHNRSRDKLDKMIEDHGLDSRQFATWRKENLDFDPSVPHPAFDPGRDAVVRRASTRDADWSPDDGRSVLSFDTRVKRVWMDHELSKIYAGSVQIDDEANQKQYTIPLFRCPATHQLVTRDAFDIDHQRPISEVLQTMCDHSANGKISKAAALDAYNDVSNLRLVNRSANSSHEWEQGIHGEYDSDHDFGVDDTRDMFNDSPQPLRMNEPDHPHFAMFKQALEGMYKVAPPGVTGMSNLEYENASSSLVCAAIANGMNRIDDVVFNAQNQNLIAVEGKPPANGKYSALTLAEATDRTLEQNSDAMALMPKPHGLMLAEAMQELRDRQRFIMTQALDLRDKGILDFEYSAPNGSKPPLMSNPHHPDHADFLKARAEIQRLDPEGRTLPHDSYRDNLAAAVVKDARDKGIAHIDGFTTNPPQKTTLFAIQGNVQNLQDPGNLISSTNVSRGALTPIDWSTSKVDDLHQQQALAAQQQQNLGQSPKVQPMQLS
jgi:hypothetical protein